MLFLSLAWLMLLLRTIRTVTFINQIKSTVCVESSGQVTKKLKTRWV